MITGTATHRRAVLATWIALLMLPLGGCERRQVEEGLRDARQQVSDAWDKIKPDSELFRGIVVGQSTEADLLRQAGKPELVWEFGNGNRRLEYPRSPEGAHNWMVSIGADGRVMAIEQVLTADNIATIQPGMSQDDVRRILGKPSQITHFALKGEDVWSWRWWEQPTETAMFNAHFDAEGRVTTTSRSDDPKRR
jgi:SmpA / OmlA family